MGLVFNLLSTNPNSKISMTMKKAFVILLALLVVAGGGYGLSKTGVFQKKAANDNHLKNGKTDSDSLKTVDGDKQTGEITTMHWETDSHNFGEVPQGTPVRHTFKFTNTGKTDLLIENVKPACQCTVTEYTKEAVAPGESGIVVAEYNAKNPGVFKKSLTVLANTEPKAKILNITGEVVN